MVPVKLPFQSTITLSLLVCVISISTSLPPASRTVTLGNLPSPWLIACGPVVAAIGVVVCVSEEVTSTVATPPTELTSTIPLPVKLSPTAFASTVELFHKISISSQSPPLQPSHNGCSSQRITAFHATGAVNPMVI